MKKNKLTIGEWLCAILNNKISDENGYGNFISNKEGHQEPVFVADFFKKDFKIPDWATHIEWISNVD